MWIQSAKILLPHPILPHLPFTIFECTISFSHLPLHYLELQTNGLVRSSKLQPASHLDFFSKVEVSCDPSSVTTVVYAKESKGTCETPDTISREYRLQNLALIMITQIVKIVLAIQIHVL